jgi:hypothetical protein
VWAHGVLMLAASSAWGAQLGPDPSSETVVEVEWLREVVARDVVARLPGGAVRHGAIPPGFHDNQGREARKGGTTSRDE